MKEKSKQMRFFVLLVFSAVLVANSIIVNSPLIGIVASLGFLSLISVVIGEVLYSSENLFFKCLFGLATFLLLLAISGFGLMLIGMFTEFLSLVVLVVISVLFGIIALHGKSRFPNIREGSSVSERDKKSKDLNSYILILIFLSYVVLAFRFLLLARTSEGEASVWLEISPLFLPTFAVMSLILALILFFTPVNDSLKLVLLLVYAFLVHSLFLTVWYPSRYGDPLQHLGEARYTARTGTIYAYGWLTSNFLIVPLVMGRAQYALVIFFERMFSIDIYWAHAFLVPLLWSIFVPSLAYKIAELLTTKRNRVFPLLTALSTGLFSSLILWGTVSVPNSLGFIFLFLSAVLLLRWMRSGGRWNWFMSLLAVSVTLLAHLQPGLFALILFLWGNIVQRSSRTVLRIAGLFMTSILYPVALYISGASFALSDLFILENFLSFQSEITTILLAFGLVGLMLELRGKYVNLKVALTVFAFYATILFEYYLTNFGMTNLPYGPQRILAIGDFLLVPFVGLGLLAITDMLRKAVEKGGKKFSLGFSSKRIRLNLNSRLIALALISLFVSAQATSILYQAYPRKEAVYYQPSAYMIEAVRYIDADAPGRYVVLCDFTVARVAIGFLGIDYGWAGGVRGVFGMPEWTYPTMAMYADMVKKPSIEIMQQAMNSFNAPVSYFVVWVGQFGFDEIVQRTSEILPVNRVFGDGNLYIFRYPLPVIEESGPPVKVIFDDGVLTRSVETRLTYMFETEINSTLTLSGYTSYNITEYPIHWAFSDLRVNNVPRPFDEASDINTFVYVKGLEPNDILTVKWRWNRKYPGAVWKEDSFRSGWRTHDLYKGTIIPTIVNDGNILNMSYSFTPGPYLYYYYVKAVNISTTENQYIMVKWKSDSTVAVVAYYSELGLGSGFEVVRTGSESTDWMLTTVELPSNAKVTYVMVGISNIRTRSISGMKTLSVDYILISTST
ncbi:MAG: hypothetical protein OEY88_06950 [Candidatus Bathyarchaeota archaeon]|nr:hypothetical protein [Candidatus Bathyarchaeota archaeon]